MPGALINIGRSGTIAARTALELTAQNIANADNPAYARRSIGLAEFAGDASVAGYSNATMNGVRVDRILRSDSTFVQAEARRTSSDLARANSEIAGLRNAETAVEQSGFYPAINAFEQSLAQLEADPLDTTLRAGVLEAARVLTESFHIANRGLVSAQAQVQGEAGVAVGDVNLQMGELARINGALVRALPSSTAAAALLDQRDAALSQLAASMDISVSYGPTGAVEVRAGSNAGPVMVAGETAATLAHSVNPDGTLAFTLDGSAISIQSGGLAGRNLALGQMRDFSNDLDGLAQMVITRVNTVQTGGTAPDGSAGAPFFSGTGAADIALALADGSAIATAPAGAPAGSRDPANLVALRAALASNGPAAAGDALLLDISSRIAGREVTQGALATIADSARASLLAETGVDLDSEATNLVRYQQAFEASGKVIQVAADIFDTILGIR